MQLIIRYFGYFIVLIKNVDIQENDKHILSKMVFSFRDKSNSERFITKGTMVILKKKKKKKKKKILKKFKN